MSRRCGRPSVVRRRISRERNGTAREVAEYLEAFRIKADADELITAHQAPTKEGRLRSVTLTAEAMGADSV